MPDIPIEQAIYGSQSADGYRFLARSPGFLADWLPEAERLCTGIGERPAGVACPACVFAQPFGKRHVAIVQVADQGPDDIGRPGTLGFRLLVFPRAAYVDFIGDPFVVAERWPPSWQAAAELPTLAWPAEPLPSRTVAEVQNVLKQVHGPTFLGGVQVLVDGGRMVFERPAPDPELVRNLWMLLPYSDRGEKWPASFAFGNALGFDLLVVPRADPETFASYVHEEQAGDYPQGRYELNLQIAAESGSQVELDALFARRSSSQTIRLTFLLIGVMMVLGVVIKLLPGTPRTVPPATTAARKTGPNLPAASSFHSLSDPERKRLTEALRELTIQLNLTPLPESATAEALLGEIDQHLGSSSERNIPLRNYSPVERQLRALLWKQEIAEYNDVTLNPVELVERLHQKVVPRKAKRE